MKRYFACDQTVIFSCLQPHHHTRQTFHQTRYLACPAAAIRRFDRPLTSPPLRIPEDHFPFGLYHISRLELTKHHPASARTRTATPGTKRRPSKSCEHISELPLAFVPSPVQGKHHNIAVAKAPTPLIPIQCPTRTTPPLHHATLVGRLSPARRLPICLAPAVAPFPALPVRVRPLPPPATPPSSRHSNIQVQLPALQLRPSDVDYR